MIGKDFEKGLRMLNDVTKSISDGNDVKIIEMEVPARIVLTIRDTSSPATISKKLEFIYGKISEVIIKKKLLVTGAPFAIYHSYSLQSFDMEAGIPIDKKVEIPGQVICRELPEIKAIMASFWGPYEGTAVVYTAIEKYINEKHYTISGPPWEVYVTDPTLVPDTMKWQTDVYYPIK
jgi:effector-binding domain-containing protein